MIPQNDPHTHNQEHTKPDPLIQAGELLRRFAAVEGQLEPTVVAASLAYAQALELRRVGDLLEALVAVQKDAADAQIMRDWPRAHGAGYRP